MSLFADVVGEFADELTDGADGGFVDGVWALAEKLKEAEGERFRIDHDVPQPGDLYFLRIEDADGRRLGTRVPAAELRMPTMVRVEAIAARAKALATALEIHAGRLSPVSMANGELVEKGP